MTGRVWPFVASELKLRQRKLATRHRIMGNEKYKDIALFDLSSNACLEVRARRQALTIEENVEISAEKRKLNAFRNVTVFRGVAEKYVHLNSCLQDACAIR